MKNLRFEVIKYAKMLNSKKLSALRSGNISARYKNGFLITQVFDDNFSNEKYLLLWVAWYKEKSGAKQFQEEIEKIAKLFNCKSIQFWTNKKDIRDYGITYGYNKITYKCIKEI